MTPLALAFVLFAACLHTGWNLILKGSQHKQHVGWWAMLVGALIFSPMIIVAWPLPIAIWPYLLASAIAEVAYMLLLSSAYGHGDFSLIYPIARGTAPAWLTLWSVLFLGDQISPGGMVGFVLILAGLVVIGIGQWHTQAGNLGANWKAIGLALGVAFAISIYSAIDAAAVRIANPAAYNALVFAATWLAQAPLMLVRYGAQPAIRAFQLEWRRILPIGILMLATYGLVLAAYATSTASYVGAIREVSIVIAAFVGWRWLGEGFGPLRIVGACLTFAGIVAIAILA
jgi:drug/metabolite transporter (DMT)-like permease